MAWLSSRSARLGGLLGACALLALCAVASLAIGSRSIPLGDVVRAFTAYDGSDAAAIVRDLRVPGASSGCWSARRSGRPARWCRERRATRSRSRGSSA